MLPSDSIDILIRLTGLEIINVKRQLYKGDFDLPDYEQNADGPIQLIFSNNMVVHFVSMTESDSVGIFIGSMPAYGSSYMIRDLSENSFWMDRIGQKIEEIHILQSVFVSEYNPNEFGIELIFADKKTVCIEYLDDEDNPDMIRVISSYKGLCNRKKVG